MSHIYADITNTYTTGSKTGIQRVVRELSRRLESILPKMVFLHFDREKGCYFKLRARDIFDAPSINKGPGTKKNADPFSFDDFNPGDIFLEMDAAWGDPLDRSSLLSPLKKRGVIIVCLHYDAVPVLFPDFSHPNTVYRYTGYLAAHLNFADYFICISNTVRKDLQKLSLEITKRRVTAFTLPLGADFVHSSGKNHLDTPGQGNHRRIKKITANQFLLAVGTLEPRKNHQMVLDAFDRIQKTAPLNLVILGKKGWNVDPLADKIKNRPDFGERLFWLEDADDLELQQLYHHAFACVNVSHYEGYGLPVMEALNHNCVTICSRGGALEEISAGACHILAENTAACLGDDIMMLLNDHKRYAHYKARAQNFTPLSWDDSYLFFVNILNSIRNAEDFNWGFIPRQGVYISIDPLHLSLSLESVAQNMTFIKKITLLTADRYKNEMKAVLNKTSFEFTIITDEEIFDKFKVNPADYMDHTRRNTFLRMALFKDDAIDPNFISFDDDYLVQRKVDIDFFMEGSAHSGYYFIEDARQWMGTPGHPTSYDAGIFNTHAQLKSCGYKSRIFSSHMPQIINKKMAERIYDRMVHPHAGSMCEWTLYFNIFSFLYPDHCRPKTYATLSWPCRPTDWIPSKLPGEYYFENYYEWNYEKNGLFEGLPVIGAFSRKTALWEKSFAGQFKQRDLNQKQFGCDNPEIIFFDDSIKLNFSAWDVLENELLRIRLVNKTKNLKKARLSVGLLKDEKVLSRTEVDALTAGWIPVKPLNTDLTLELVFLGEKKSLPEKKPLPPEKKPLPIDQTHIKINVLPPTDKEKIYAPPRSGMTRKELTARLLQIDNDDLFVKKAYLLILGRNAGLKELELAVIHLKTGLSRKDIIVNMLLSRERKQNNWTAVKLSFLEKRTLFLKKKWRSLLSRIRALVNFSQSNTIQKTPFDHLIFELGQKLAEQEKRLDLQEKSSDLQEKSLAAQHHQIMEIQSNLLFFQQQEAQAQQRRLDQFFFDVRQELRRPVDGTGNTLEKLATISSHAIDPYYPALEERFRGSRDEIMTRYAPYLTLIKPFIETRKIQAVDIGCARGEWLQIISGCCADARGIDNRGAMVAECRTFRLAAEQADILDWLEKQPDQSIDLITAFNVIASLPFRQLHRLTGEIYRTLTPGGLVMLEAPNPDNLHVATSIFYTDPNRKKPIPKEVTEHLLEYHGFMDIKIHPVNPFPKNMHLEENTETARRFNLLAYGPRDYLIIGKKNNRLKI